MTEWVTADPQIALCPGAEYSGTNTVMASGDGRLSV